MNLGTFILVSVPLTIQYFAHLYRESDHASMLQELQEDLAVPKIRTYDFIVVGGGSAGCVVAGRLSEHFSVLLLEAGGNPVPATEVPAFMWPVAADREINYYFDSVPQPNAGQELGGVLDSSAGKMMGGSGSHNDMVHNRGNPRDFDTWAELTSDPSWSYENVLRYFKKYEDFIGVLFDEGQEDAYGHGGPLTVDTYLNPLVPFWFEAARELGYHVGDPNGRQRESFTPLHVMVDKGRRVSAYTGFIRPFEETRENLTVLRYSDVQEILIDDGGKGTRAPRAFGIAYERHGIAQRAYTSKEVIVSGGTIRSPLLLMKSGIGPRDVLEEAGIPVKVERPGVGRNLNEHPTIGFGPIFVNDSSLLGRIRDGDEAELERYHATGDGLLGEIGEGPQALLVSSRAKAAGEDDWPDIQIQLHLRPEGLGPAAMGEDESLNMWVINGRSRQRGSVRLNGTAWRAGERDDQRLTVIDMQLLTDPSDVDVLLEGIRRGLRIFEDTSAFQRVGARYGDEHEAQCKAHEYGSDEYWRCYILWRSFNWNHFAGTCAMGRENDPEGLAVVDSVLGVIGVDGLRVIDASVMPVVPNANINAPVLMLAEKGADEILNVHGVENWE